MKNKVMGKALSWVLSAAMALTMSGAIPAMTTSVYASQPVLRQIIPKLIKTLTKLRLQLVEQDQ
jgi:hypothetical protein